MDKITEDFHKKFYLTKELDIVHWLGVPTMKCPLDLWVYQEILFDCRPDFIIETGTAYGGSALFLATICDGIGKGQIITIDSKWLDGRPEHKRIHYLHGSSTENNIIAKIRRLTNLPYVSIMAILDSDHRAEHVSREIMVYKDLVTAGQYMIIEDTNLNGYPVFEDFGPGPMEAINHFLKNLKLGEDFTIDKSREKFYLTYNLRGYLKKKGQPQD